MRIIKRGRFGAAASIGAAVLAVTMAYGGSVGALTAASVPAYPTSFGVAPLFLNVDANGQSSVSNIVRSSGSDTTLFMMQTISDLYNDAGLYACTLNGSSLTVGSTTYGAESICKNPAQNSGVNTNLNVTDVNDNFTGTEVLNETNDIGSGSGQNQLCGLLNDPNGVPNFARSSKPSTGACSDEVALGYAKDEVPTIDFPFISPGQFGDATFYAGTVFEPSGNAVTPPAFPANGLIGPVAAGWLPGDPLNCVPATVPGGGAGPAGTKCSGTPFTDIDNGVAGGASTGTGANSVAYRLFCDTGSDRIYDWGQLTNLSAAHNGGTAQPVGKGAPIGVPIRIVDVNPGSGTAFIIAQFALSGVTGTGAAACNASATQMDANAASGANPFTNDGPTANFDQVIENNASQIGTTAAEEFPNDPADQAVEVATSLYFMSNGVYNSNPNSKTSTIVPGSVSVGSVPLTTTGQAMAEDNVVVGLSHELNNSYPTARTLFNIYRTGTVTASTAGFLNWVCDSQSEIQKQNDLVTGTNYDAELTNAINLQYGFHRLTDSTGENANVTNPGDGQLAPNGACDAQLTVGVTPGSATVSVASGTAGVHVGAAADTLNGDFPSGTTVVSVAANSITLSANDAGSTGGSDVLYLPGTAPVLSVAAANVSK